MTLVNVRLTLIQETRHCASINIHDILYPFSSANTSCVLSPRLLLIFICPHQFLHHLISPPGLAFPFFCTSTSQKLHIFFRALFPASTSQLQLHIPYKLLHQSFLRARSKRWHKSILFRLNAPLATGFVSSPPSFISRPLLWYFLEIWKLSPVTLFHRCLLVPVSLSPSY